MLCCQVGVLASDLSLVQRSPTECGVSECYHEDSTMRRPWPTTSCYGDKIYIYIYIYILQERRCRLKLMSIKEVGINKLTANYSTADDTRKLISLNVNDCIHRLHTGPLLTQKKSYQHLQRLTSLLLTGLRPYSAKYPV